jgi:TfoX/Sxy family transcriptional regulator of competence genes
LIAATPEICYNSQNRETDLAEPYLTQLQQIVAQIEPLSAGSVSLEFKHFFSGAALYADGQICASLSPSGFALKLPENTRLKLLADGKGAEFRFFSTGPVKKEYIALSDPVLKDEQFLKELMDLSANYVVSQLD